MSAARGVHELRTAFFEADVRGTRWDDAALERTSIDRAVFGEVHASGAHGTIHAAPAFIEVTEGLERAEPEEVLVYLRAAGADLSFWMPPRNEA